ncbi:MAG: type IV pilus secretin PilQ [Deltaproteobacteria bacterium]|nr:type IV pilus secretin PilQ [Deltaproteobacteria bacterium]
MSINERKWITTIHSLLTLLFFVLFLYGCATGTAVRVAEDKEEARQPTIEDIRVDTSHDGSTVKIVSSMETPHAGIKLMNPPRIYIDLKGAPAAGLSRRMDVNNGLIKRIRVQERQDQKYITRVVVYLSKGGLEYNIDSRGPHIFLKVIRPPLQASANNGRTGPMKTARETGRIFFKPGPSSLTQILGLDFNVFEGGRSKLTVTTDKKARYGAKMTGPRTLLINVYNATAPPLLLRRLDSKYFEGAVERVKAFSSPKNQRVSIRIRMREKVPYHISQAEGRLEVRFDPSGAKPPSLALHPRGFDKKQRPSGPSKGTSTGSRGYEGALADYAGRKMSFDFVDTDIRNVLKLIAEAIGLNIVWGSEVQGKVSLKLDSVPWDQALEMILKPNDLTYQIEGNIMWVVPRSKLIDMEIKEKERRKALLAQKRIDEVFEPKVVEFVVVKHRRAKDVFCRLVGKAGGKECPNSIGILDITVAKRPTKEKGEEEGLETKLATLDVIITYDDPTNTIIFNGTRRKIEKAKEIIKWLDAPEKQVMIEARIVDAATNFVRDLGIRWNSLLGQKQTNRGIGFQTNPTLYANPQDARGSFSFSSNSPANWRSTVGLLFSRLGSGGLSALAINAALALAETEGQTRIISAPKVLARSGEEAIISRGDKIITPPAEQVKAQEIEAVLSLKVTPTVSTKDYVNLKLEVTNDSAVSPTLISKQSVISSFTVKSGETVVIGGIYDLDQATEEEGIPVARKIPLLGWLFKAERKTNTKRELLIFITATIISKRFSATPHPLDK